MLSSAQPGKGYAAACGQGQVVQRLSQKNGVIDLCLDGLSGSISCFYTPGFKPACFAAKYHVDHFP